MRVLFSCVASEGHLLPLVPLAHAFRDGGHDVAVATAPTFGARVEECGLAALPAGLDGPELNARFAPDREQIRSLPIPERRRHEYSRRFGRIDAPARVDDLHARAREFGPHVLIHESAELAAPVVAAALGLPSVHHGFGRLIPAVAIEAAAVEAAPMWRAAGVEPDRHAGLFRGPYVDICPPSLAPEPPPRGTFLLRRRAVDVDAAPPKSKTPLVYVTLGTVVSNADALRTVIAALAGLDAEVLVTTGAQNDPAALGPLPPNTVVERYVPQATVLPRASVVVTHAGSGSTLGALAHGLPILAVPQMADQFDNAAACARAGAALVLLPAELNEAAVRTAIDSLLGDESFRIAAQTVAAEIAAMPSPRELADSIEELCRPAA